MEVLENENLITACPGHCSRKSLAQNHDSTKGGLLLVKSTGCSARGGPVQTSAPHNRSYSACLSFSLLIYKMETKNTCLTVLLEGLNEKMETLFQELLSNYHQHRQSEEHDPSKENVSWRGLGHLCVTIGK